MSSKSSSSSGRVSGFRFRVSASVVGLALVINVWALSKFLLVVDLQEQQISYLPPLLEHHSGGEPPLLHSALKICPQTRSLFNESHLHDAITSATNFHVKGGNLLSVTAFKNSAIDNTLKKMKVKFESSAVVSPEKKEGQPPVVEIIEKDHVKKIMSIIKKKNDPRGGYGKPLPGTFTPPNNPLIWEDRRIDVTEPWDKQRWRASEGPKGECLRLTKLSGSKRSYEDKWICGDLQNCTVISIGSNDQWGMETALKEYGCETHTFDCTLKDNKAKNQPPNSPNMHFYPHCISSHTAYIDEETKRSYMTYREMIELTGLQTPPTLLKMDVEGFEYDVLTQMLQDDYLLPLQIQVELHWATKMVDVPWMLRTLTSAELALFSGMMFTSGGYLPVHRDESCTVCLEVLYVRALC